MNKRNWLAAALLAGAWGVQAAPDAVVDAIQAPAWVERGDLRQPLVPGMELRNHDRLVTGPGARAIVQLADGSAVKLGESTQVGVNALGKRDSGVFTAALDVAAGAFRLTTDIFRKFQIRRAINVRAGTVTAGIRGTDLWGRSGAERDFICLLEGRITVSHPRGEALELTAPLQFYGADKGKAPGPVATVDRAQAALWALQTELQDGAGTFRRGGRWAVRLAVADSETAAFDLHDRAQAAGYGVKIDPLRGDGGQYRYVLRVGQIAGESEARLLASRLARELELAAPQVEKR